MSMRRGRCESATELDGYARAGWDMRARYWGLLAGNATAYGFEFESGVLSGFDCAADGFADEARDFDAALLDV